MLKLLTEKCQRVDQFAKRFLRFELHSDYSFAFSVQPNVLEPNDYYVTKLRDGRSFCHRLVEAFPVNKSESDSITPYFRMDCSFKTPEKDAASFLSPMPNVPYVEKLQDFNSYVKSLDL
ncbi:unnamed protein product [Schistosoma mattheei]|uniref:Uncharacterized protein n=1 Tax=Schistosoma mattheei TaxID=31246 RepID=A0A183NQN4_9TREM|nr:unnamed protein product [Schistosoma mattheei]